LYLFLFKKKTNINTSLTLQTYARIKLFSLIKKKIWTKNTNSSLKPRHLTSFYIAIHFFYFLLILNKIYVNKIIYIIFIILSNSIMVSKKIIFFNDNINNYFMNYYKWTRYAKLKNNAHKYSIVMKYIFYCIFFHNFLGLIIFFLASHVNYWLLIFMSF
jgi:hypothetical protein